jgi:hypothetical protein
MWKILVGFAIFAALAIYILQKSGGDVDLGGEKHEVAPAAGAAHGTAASPAAMPAPGASAASAAAK